MLVRLTSDQPKAGGGIVPKGTEIEHKWAILLVENGQAEPVDEEAKAKWQSIEAKQKARAARRAKAAAVVAAEKEKKRARRRERIREVTKAQYEALKEIENSGHSTDETTDSGGE